MKSLDRFRVRTRDGWKLAAQDSAATPGCKNREDAEERLAPLREKLIDQQAKLYADGQHGFLLVLQGLDASGKDGLIRSVLSGVNPQGCHVSSFKSPSSVECNHDYLWRIHHSVPARGRFVIFNRSHYEDVLIVRVHADKILPAWARKRKNLWAERYEQINNFEKLLTQNNVGIVKVFLHISKDEQKRRLEKRLGNPAKNWKFEPGDLAERARWDEYMKVYNEVLHATSTDWAPWHVVPADNKWYRNLVVAALIVAALKKMDLAYPKADPKAIEGIVVN